MFLNATIHRNPQLIRAAIELHQSRMAPPNTYVIDLDSVLDNTRKIVDAARHAGIKLYGMTKQHGRNPLLGRAMVAAGIQKAVAVDFDEANTLYAYGVPIGHIGHLTQVPDGALQAALRMAPEVITVFCEQKAQRIDEAARQLHNVQALLVRVTREGDFFYESQEGGLDITALDRALARIAKMKGVRVEGVTTFPCLVFDPQKGEAVPTRNLDTILMAAEIVRKVLGRDKIQVNGPGMTAAGTIPILARAGVTHAEPGSSLTGHTPLHAHGEQPERPAMVYVSEVSHRIGDRIFTYGGGFYQRGRMEAAIITSSPEAAFNKPPLPVKPRSAEVIDYYGEVQGNAGEGCRIGDSVVYAFRSQVFVSRSYVAVVTGVERGRPELLGLFDHLGNPLDRKRRMPLGLEAGTEAVEEAWRAFARDQYLVGP